MICFAIAYNESNERWKCGWNNLSKMAINTINHKYTHNNINWIHTVEIGCNLVEKELLWNMSFETLVHTDLGLK